MHTRAAACLLLSLLLLPPASEALLDLQRFDGCTSLLKDLKPQWLASYKQIFSDMAGWMEDIHLIVARRLMKKQLSMCVLGTVGEVGVFQGKYFLALATTSLPQERRLAIDLFEQQDANIDQSATDGLEGFTANLKSMNLTDYVTQVSADSTMLNATFFRRNLVPAFRWLSVDGGHSFETTLSDLKLAASLIRPGGVVVVDDFENPTWAGVQDAVYYFLHRQTLLVPFLRVANKLYLTTRHYHATYLHAVQTLSNCLICTMSAPGEAMHESRYTMARSWHVCVGETHGPRKGCRVEDAE